MAIDASRLAGKPWWQVPFSTSAVRRHAAPGRPAEKGDHGGECQRIACGNPGAHWFNETNGRYYCASCARTFNEISRRHGQPPLCELHL